MTSHALESVALALVAEGKGILAADETVPTLTKRFDTLGIRSTEQSRRTQPASGLLTGRFNGAATVGSIRMRWRRHCSASMIHRIAVTGATTNAHAARWRNAQLDEIGFRGGDHGKHAV